MRVLACVITFLASSVIHAQDVGALRATVGERLSDSELELRGLAHEGRNHAHGIYRFDGALDLFAPADRLPLPVGAVLQIDLPQQHGRQFVVESVEESIDGARTLVGREAGLGYSQLAITSSSSTIFGSIDIDSSRYIVRTDFLGDVVLLDVDTTSFAGCATEELFHQGTKIDKAVKSPLGGVSKSASTARTVDILVAYSPGVAASFAGDPTSFINNLASDFNATFQGSDVNASVRLVGYLLNSQLPDEQTSSTQFQVLRNSLRSGASPFVGYGSLRETFDADLIVALVRSTSPTALCGIADVYEDSDFTNPAQASGSKAFVILNSHCAAADRTFHHEVGHLLGGRHEEPQGLCGVGDIGCGYTDLAAPFRTIMGDSDQSGFTCETSGCPRIARFSAQGQSVFFSGANRSLSTVPWMDFRQLLHSYVDPPEQVPPAGGGTVPLVAGYRTPDAGVPGIPANVATTSCGSVHDLSWTAASGTVGWYEVERATSAAFSPVTFTYRGPGTFTTVQSGSTFYWRVRACNAAHCGSWVIRGPISYKTPCN